MKSLILTMEHFAPGIFLRSVAFLHVFCLFFLCPELTTHQHLKNIKDGQKNSDESDKSSYRVHKHKYQICACARTSLIKADYTMTED